MQNTETKRSFTLLAIQNKAAAKPKKERKSLKNKIYQNE